MNLEGFRRVERDDRLLDVFPQETREKGVELWENWLKEKVEIVRVLIDRPPGPKNIPQKFILDRRKLEQALLENKLIGKLRNF
jgi:hypothetical protein